MLFEAVRFALIVAEETGGAFDPTLGNRMAARGYNRHYATRETCREDGWRTARRADGSVFKSQGDCVSYVQTGR